MNNIGKREKIILALMCVVILYGLYSFFLESPSGKKEAADVTRQEEMNRIGTLVTTVSVSLKEGMPSSVDAYIIKEAQKEWGKDPFYTAYEAETEKTTAELPDFAYTGYVEYGSSRLAVINGVDYRVGESLELPGFVLLSVAPSKVVILDREGKRNITVPFKEE